MLKSAFNTKSSTTGGAVHNSIAGGTVIWGRVRIMGGELQSAQTSVLIGPGAGALLEDTSTTNTIIGNEAANSTTGVDNNVVIGKEAAQSITQNEAVIIGYRACQIMEGLGAANVGVVYIGSNAGKSLVSPHSNTVVGTDTGNNVTDGIHTTWLGAQIVQTSIDASHASQSTVVGYQAAQNADTSIDTTICGVQAGQNGAADAGATAYFGYRTGRGAAVKFETAVGAVALSGTHDGAATRPNVALGYNAGVNLTGTSNGNIFIGYGAGPTSAGALTAKLYLHNAQSDTPLISGDFDAPTMTINGDLTLATQQVIADSTDTPSLRITNTTASDADEARSGIVRFRGETSAGTAHTLATITAQHDGASDDTKGQLAIAINDGSDGETPTLAMTIDSAQDVVCPGDLSCNSVTETSDRRLKNVTSTMTPEECTTVLRQLRPIRFRRRGRERIGFSAQQVRSVLPEAVVERNGVLNICPTAIMSVLLGSRVHVRQS